MFNRYLPIFLLNVLYFRGVLWLVPCFHVFTWHYPRVWMAGITVHRRACGGCLLHHLVLSVSQQYIKGEQSTVSHHEYCGKGERKDKLVSFLCLLISILLNLLLTCAIHMTKPGSQANSVCYLCFEICHCQLFRGAWINNR